MLLQSHEGVIRLLPSLPDDWKDGSFKGLCARCGFVVSAEWKNGEIVSCEILSKNGGECRVELPANGTVYKTVINTGKNEKQIIIPVE